MQETVTSATALAQSLKGELVESKKRLAALVENSSLGATVGSNRNETTGFLEKVFVDLKRCWFLLHPFWVLWFEICLAFSDGLVYVSACTACNVVYVSG
jgi:hypothetical protein